MCQGPMYQGGSRVTLGDKMSQHTPRTTHRKAIMR